jgi:osmotically-inducible protein OsmY
LRQIFVKLHLRAAEYPGLMIASRLDAGGCKMSRRKWLLCSALAMTTMVACRTNESPEGQVNDMEITAQVKSKLASQLGVTTVPNISVNSTNGVVTLSGQVNTAENKARAGEIAGTIPKVVRVDNNLQVAPRS